jgi:hypothetical protein
LTTEPTWALCLGGAAEVWEDVRALEELVGPWPGIVIAANDVGASWPRPLDHWVSLHAYKLPRWIALREGRGYPGGFLAWGLSRDASCVHYTVVPWGGGSSGLLAVQAAQMMGCTRAVLCGMPMTPTPHFGETQERFHPQWFAATAYWVAWKRNAHRMLGWVTSMGGRTRELLGAPTAAWLHERGGQAGVSS